MHVLQEKPSSADLELVLSNSVSTDSWSVDGSILDCDVSAKVDTQETTSAAGDGVAIEVDDKLSLLEVQDTAGQLNICCIVDLALEVKIGIQGFSQRRVCVENFIIVIVPRGELGDNHLVCDVTSVQQELDRVIQA